MIEAIEDAERLKVIEGIDLIGNVNTDEASLLANIRHSIRLGHPQVRPQAAQPDRVCLVGGGPSLEATFTELLDLYYAGAKVITVNGAYQWCLDRHIRPSAQIVLDARAFNAKFLVPSIPQCRYLLASQCHPDLWAAVDGRDVWIWHAIGPENALRSELDTFYHKAWTGIPGGTTVVMRAISLLRTLGFLRMDLFGVDSCYINGSHHAYEQIENTDTPKPFKVWPTEHPERVKTFWCAGWMCKQLEDFCQMVRLNGHQFLLNVHGEGLLAYALQSSGQVEVVEDAAVSDGACGKGE